MFKSKSERDLIKIIASEKKGLPGPAYYFRENALDLKFIKPFIN
jgi:hypothetical protein